MLIGWGTLAVPTGIVTAEMTVRRQRPPVLPRICAECGAAAATEQSRYCHACGAVLPPPPGSS
jgi:voltage-gated potassium channel